MLPNILQCVGQPSPPTPPPLQEIIFSPKCQEMQSKVGKLFSRENTGSEVGWFAQDCVIRAGSIGIETHPFISLAEGFKAFPFLKNRNKTVLIFK